MSDNTNNTNISTQTNQAKAGFFDVYNRAYRLVAAVFVVVKLMDDGNDLRQRIEKIALDVMSLCVQFKDNTSSNSHKLHQSLERSILELISYIDIAALSGFISAMNGAVLKKEFESFLSELSSYTDGEESQKISSIHSILNDTNTGAVKDYIHSNKSLPSGTEGQRVPNKHEPVVEDAKRQKRKDTRKHLIFEYIQKNGNVSIRDIVPNIKGCSEKTVQRELLDLVKEGKVKKVGERRWSRYSLI